MTWLLAARGVLSRTPWQVWVALAVLAVWYWERDRYGDSREAEARAGMQAHINAANAAAVAARESEQQALLALSKETDNAVSQSRAVERDSTDRFIATGGVPDNAVCPSRPAAPGGVHSAGDSAAVRETPVVDDRPPLPSTVRVYPEDVRICTENTILAEEWRDLLLGLEARSAE